MGVLCFGQLGLIDGFRWLAGFKKPKDPSLPEFLDFKLFGKTILAVNRKFGLLLAHQLRK